MEKSRKTYLAKRLWQRLALMLFGVLLAFALLEAGLQAASFSAKAFKQCRNWINLRTGGSYRILCIGESMTQGQYPRFLEKILNARQTRLRFSVIDEGFVGTDTNIIAEKLEDDIKKFKPDMVVAMIGINDEGAKHIPVGFTTQRRSFAQSLKTHRLFQLLLMHIQAKFGIMQDRVSGKPRSEAVIVPSRDDVHYLRLGMKLYAQRRIGEAKDAFRQAVSLNPLNVDAYNRWMFLCEPKEQEAMIQRMMEKYQKESILCSQEDPFAGYLFCTLDAFQKHLEAEALLKVLRKYCRAGWISYFSGKVAVAQGRYEEAAAYFLEAIKLNDLEGHPPHNDRPYLELANVYRALGKSDLSEECLSKGSVLVDRGYKAATVVNYRRIKKQLDERGIRLICVQYPMRDVEPLKRIFSQNQDQDVSFVDNEKLFKDALKKYRFEEIFRDRFAGDFGHCTPLGNKLLANQIATVILSQVLGMK